jgi:DNA modification methylase
MEVEIIGIDSITPSEYNPRKISIEDYDKLTKSIKEFGLIAPIIVNLKNMHIVGGHQRYKVLHDEHVKELHLIRLGDVGFAFTDTDLSIEDENHEKALNLALNKISGDFDEGKLNNIIYDLNLSIPDLEITVFDELDLNKMQISLDKRSREKEDIEKRLRSAENKDRRLNISVNVQKGDIWELGNHRLMCGDSNNMSDIKKLMNNQEINLLLTDPPYGINIVPKSGKICNSNTYKLVLNDDKPFHPDTLLKLDCPSIIFGGNHFASELPNGSHWIVWLKHKIFKKEFSMGNIELAWTNLDKKSSKLYYHQWSGNIREGDMKSELKRRVHPTQKPVGLLKQILKDTNIEGNVLDLFGGSGSTLIACEQLNCNCYMMELDPYYCQIIINRWEEFTGEKAEKIN